MKRSLKTRIKDRLRRDSYELFARIHRRRLQQVSFVGITGSAGKTTVKNLTAHILASDGPCSSTVESRNELFYVSQLILNTKATDKYCVVEVHGGDPGIMDRPLKVVRHQIGVLTNIGSDHFKSFTNIEDIAAEKRKIVDSLPENGTAVLNRDDPRVRKIGEGSERRIIWVGKDEGSTLQLIESRSDYPLPLTLTVKYKDRIHTIKTQLHGNHLAGAVLISVGVAIAANLPIESAITAIAGVLPVEGRMELVKTRGGVTFIRDDFKAPYWSIKAPIEFLHNARVPRKIAVFGTISDYAGDTPRIYRQLARFALSKADVVVFVGPNALRALKAREAGDEDRLQAFPEIGDAALFLRNQLRDGDLVLLKGSSKADHLVRLVLDREKAVKCWKTRCEIFMFCQNCDMVYAETDSTQSAVEDSGSMRKPLEPDELTGHKPGDIAIVVGLGNPGTEYQHTPHNVGQRALDMLVNASAGTWTSKPEGDVCELTISGTRVLLFKPADDINVSGLTIREFVERHGCTHEDFILVHDDLDLPPGKVKRKSQGSDGGHKGVRSVIMALGTGSFLRVKIGVKPVSLDESKLEYVLKKFDEETDAVIESACGKAGSFAKESVTLRTKTGNFV